MKKIFNSKALFFLSLTILILTFGGTIAFFTDMIKVEFGYNKKQIDVKMITENTVDKASDNNEIDEIFGQRYIGFSNDGSIPVFLRFNYYEFWKTSYCVDNNDYVFLKSKNNSSNKNIETLAMLTPDKKNNVGNKYDENENNSKLNNVSRTSLVKNEMVSDYDNSVTINKCSKYETSVISNKYKGKNVVIKGWNENFDDNFIQGSDGWYYYKKVFNPREVIDVLESLGIDKTLVADTNIYNNSRDYTINFYFEAVQYNDTSAKKVWDLEPIVDENGNINWNF